MKSLVVAVALVLLVLLGVQIDGAFPSDFSALADNNDEISSDSWLKIEPITDIKIDAQPLLTTCSTSELVARNVSDQPPVHANLHSKGPTEVERPPSKLSAQHHLSLTNDGHHESRNNESTTTTTAVRNVYDLSVEDARVLADWYKSFKLLHTLDHESSTATWLEYLELLLLIAFLAHFGLHLHDFIEFDGRAYLETANRFDHLDVHDNVHVDKMKQYVQCKVKTIKVASAPTHVKIQTKGLTPKAPLLLTATGSLKQGDTNNRTRRSPFSRIKDFFGKEASPIELSEKGKLGELKNAKPSRRWRDRLAVSRSASCPVPAR